MKRAIPYKLILETLNVNVNLNLNTELPKNSKFFLQALNLFTMGNNKNKF